MKKKDSKFINALLSQESKVKDPVKAVLESDATIITVESAEQLSKKLMNKPAVREMLDRILDTETLLEHHRDLLNQKRSVVTYDSKNQMVVQEMTEIPDPDTILKALDMSYKLKGMYAPEQHENINVNLDARAKDNSKLVQITEEYEEKLRNMFEQGNNKKNDTTTTNSTVPTGDSDENTAK